jgi:hypothetical protein
MTCTRMTAAVGTASTTPWQFAGFARPGKSAPNWPFPELISDGDSHNGGNTSEIPDRRSGPRRHPRRHRDGRRHRPHPGQDNRGSLARGLPVGIGKDQSRMTRHRARNWGSVRSRLITPAEAHRAALKRGACRAVLDWPGAETAACPRSSRRRAAGSATRSRRWSACCSTTRRRLRARHGLQPLARFVPSSRYGAKPNFSTSVSQSAAETS